MKNAVILFGTVALISMALAFTTSGPKPWPVPEKFEKMKNPVKPDATALAEGKALYTKHCASCHGKKGMGDGTKAATLETECGDFTKPDFKKQSDGAIFFKISEGRDDMPSFKKKLPDQEDIWKLVIYSKSLK